MRSMAIVSSRILKQTWLKHFKQQQAHTASIKLPARVQTAATHAALQSETVPGQQVTPEWGGDNAPTYTVGESNTHTRREQEMRCSCHGLRGDAEKQVR